MKVIMIIIFSLISLTSFADDDDGDVNNSKGVGADFFDKKPANVNSQILMGNYTNVKSCNDISEVKIPKNNIGSRPFGMIVTKYNNSIKPRATGEIFSDVTEVIGMSKGEIYARSTNLTGSSEWGYSLITVKETKWFNDNVAIGRPIYFVAKYVGNNNISIGQGNDKRDLPIREAVLLCANIMYSR